MVQEKTYPGGFKLARETAEVLAVREFGTARGLEPEPGMPEGCFRMAFGDLNVRIRPDAGNNSYRSSSWLIQTTVWMSSSTIRLVRLFDPDTLERDLREESIYHCAEELETLEALVTAHGPEFCHAQVNRIWNDPKRRKGAC